MFRAPLIFAVIASAAKLTAHPEIEEALARLNTQIAAAPAEAAGDVERGEHYAPQAEWLSAEANFLRAAELTPEDARLARARGALELAMQHPAAARGFLDAALSRNPRDADALVLRARAHALLKSPALALADFDAAIALIAAPTPELFLERAALLAPAAAVRSLDEAIARIGPAMVLQLRAVALEEALGRIDAAVARLDAIAAQSERKEQWLKRRGDVLANAGRERDARRAYAAALDAIAALPAWLRESPDTSRLTLELQQLTSSRS